MNIRDYIASNMPRFLEEWGSLIMIPSVSCETAHKDDMLRCAKHWEELLLEAGVHRTKIIPTKGNPLVYAEYKVSVNAPTVLVYGHYDVMPAEPLEQWKTDPWKATIIGNRLYGRGADDDKGQTLIQVKAFEYLVKEVWNKNGNAESANDTKSSPCNVKFILEGEEEIGSPSFESALRESMMVEGQSINELLKSDIILVSDTSMIGEQTPSITTGLRGLAYWQIELTGPNRDLHSGHFGGAVANPALVLCQILSQIVDDKGRITIPHFYDDVVDLSDAEREMISQIPFDEHAYMESLDVDALSGEEGYHTLERNSCRPSFDICGMWSGYTGEGSKTVIPSKAYAKVSCRLVANQNHNKISQLFADYIKQLAPDSVKVKVEPMHGGEGYICPIDLPAYKAAELGFTRAFGKKPIAARRGGSIPLISTLEQCLGQKTILMGFGLEQNKIHSPNESFDLDIFQKGVEAVVEFYNEFSKL